MTEQQKKEYWYQFHRFIIRYEAIYTPKFNKALKEQIRQYTSSGTLMAVTNTPIYEVLVELYKKTSVVWAHKSLVHRRSLKARQPIGFSDRIIQLMKQYYGIDLLNDAEGITETTKDIIRKVLIAAEEAGLGFDDIVRQLESPELNKIRARLIARTEIVTASNGAAAIQARESGLELNKEWISARDNRVRKDHLLVNGTIIPIEQDFIVDGRPMAQPGDKRGGAKEICNCRCVVAFQEITTLFIILWFGFC